MSGNLFGGISYLEAAVFVLTLIYAVVQKLGYNSVLPGAVRKLIGKLGGEEAIERIVLAVNAYQQWTPEKRREEAVKRLKELASENGISLPTSLANYLVEWIYGRLKGVL